MKITSSDIEVATLIDRLKNFLHLFFSFLNRNSIIFHNIFYLNFFILTYLSNLLFIRTLFQLTFTGLLFFRSDFFEQFFRTDVTIMSAFDDVSYFEATSYSFEPVKDNTCPLKHLFQVKIQFVSIESIVTFEVIFINNA